MFQAAPRHQPGYAHLALPTIRGGCVEMEVASELLLGGVAGCGVTARAVSRTESDGMRVRNSGFLRGRGWNQIPVTYVRAKVGCGIASLAHKSPPSGPRNEDRYARV